MTEVQNDGVVLSLSGGMDSATLLGKAVKEFGVANVHPCFFTYGSKHNRYEATAVAALACHYKTGLRLFDLSQVFGDFKSDLLMTGGDIPEGHYTDKSMTRTVVPGRNLIFGSVLAGFAESVGAGRVWLGVHAGDHAVYPDCRPSFVNSLAYTVNLSSEGRVRVEAPFLGRTKTDILKAGLLIGVPYERTRTCYKDQPAACGKCGSCNERLEAYLTLGLADPVPYGD